MALSFRTERSSDDGFPVRRLPLLITGAGGTLGSHLARALAHRYDLRLMIRPGASSDGLGSHGEVVACDLDDLVGLRSACLGIDTVVHLAGESDPSAVWRDLLPANLIGTYHLFTAAKAAGCRRVVYASSIHAVSGYPIDVQVKPTDPVNPGDLYGVSKCFGEALGRYFAEQEGLSVIALRIGACLPATAVEQDDAVGVLDAFLAQDDLVELLGRAIDDRTLVWGLFHAVSDNRVKRLDISTTREVLGYAPTEDVFRLQPALQAIGMDHRRLAHNVTDARQRSGLRDDLERLGRSAGGESPPA